MRLLNIATMQLENFSGPETAPPYSTLSHTWGTTVRVNGSRCEEPEVLYQEWDAALQADLLAAMNDGNGLETWHLGRRGRKLLGFCLRSSEFGLEYGWVDTLCIDKSVDHELLYYSTVK